MSIQGQPWPLLNGRTDEAIEFHGKALGAQLEMRMTFREAPQQPAPGMLPPGLDDQVTHSTLRIGDAVIRTFDGPIPPPGGFQGSCCPSRWRLKPRPIACSMHWSTAAR